MVTVFLLVRHFRGDGDADLGPVIEASEAETTVPVWIGERGELEVVVRPVFADPARVKFDRDRMNAAMAPNEPRHYYRLWIANHGETSRALPRPVGASLASPGAAWRSESLNVVAEESSDLPAYLEAIVRFESGAAEERVEPGELVSLLIAAPVAPTLGELVELRYEGPTPIDLRPGRISTDDLLRWEMRPRGRIGALVSYDGAAPGAAPEQAVRDR